MEDIHDVSDDLLAVFRRRQAEDVLANAEIEDAAVQCPGQFEFLGLRLSFAVKTRQMPVFLDDTLEDPLLKEANIPAIDVSAF